MRIIFLGTNGWFDSSTGKTSCVLIETENETIILDAGSGFTTLGDWLTDSKPAYCFLSHYHMDHVIGLHTLPMFHFSKGLSLFGPAPARKNIEQLINSPYSANITKLSYLVELFDATNIPTDLPFKIETLPLVHTSDCAGYRFQIGNFVIVYCTDTGYCENAVTLAHNADFLITECSLLPGEKGNGWPHISPEQAARIANEAGAKRLIMMHFDASKYKSLDQRRIAEQAARKIFPNTTVSMDGMVIELA